MAIMEIKFDRNLTSLTAAQNELLFYISNKIITRPEIKLQLIANEEKTEEIVQKRLETVSDKLKILGISSYRIDRLVVKEKAASEGVIKLVFFE